MGWLYDKYKELVEREEELIQEALDNDKMTSNEANEAYSNIMSWDDYADMYHEKNRRE